MYGFITNYGFIMYTNYGFIIYTQVRMMYTHVRNVQVWRGYMSMYQPGAVPACKCGAAVRAR